MRLLLTDPDSFLGQVLIHYLERQDCQLLLPGKGEVDWCQRTSVRDFFRRCRPTIVLNNLSWAPSQNLDRQLFIVDSARQVAAACAQSSAALIHFSSCCVFGAEAKSVYEEVDAPLPLDVSGRAFVDAERSVAQVLERALILRLGWVIDAHGDNLLSRLLQGLMAGDSVEVSAAKRGVPIAALEVAKAAVGVARQIDCGAENWGVMHFASEDACSESEFAQLVLELLSREVEVPGCLDVMPAEGGVMSAVLGGRRLREGFGVQPTTWRQGLRMLVSMWLRQHGYLAET